MSVVSRQGGPVMGNFRKSCRLENFRKRTLEEISGNFRKRSGKNVWIISRKCLENLLEIYGKCLENNRKFLKNI